MCLGNTSYFCWQNFSVCVHNYANNKSIPVWDCLSRTQVSLHSDTSTAFFTSQKH